MWWGLYLSPPENALELGVDEKSQCRALERTQTNCPWAWVMWSERCEPRAPEVRAWLAQRPLWHTHFVRSLLLELVVSGRPLLVDHHYAGIRRDSFSSVRQLTSKIARFVDS